MTEKGRQYQIAVLEKRQAKLVTGTIRKSSKIDDFVYSYENSVTEGRAGLKCY